MIPKLIIAYAYRKPIRYLKGNNSLFHTYQLCEKKCYKNCNKNLHTTIYTDKIIKELKEIGLPQPVI